MRKRKQEEPHNRPRLLHEGTFRTEEDKAEMEQSGPTEISRQKSEMREVKTPGSEGQRESHTEKKLQKSTLAPLDLQLNTKLHRSRVRLHKTRQKSATRE